MVATSGWTEPGLDLMSGALRASLTPLRSCLASRRFDSRHRSVLSALDPLDLPSRNSSSLRVTFQLERSKVGTHPQGALLGPLACGASRPPCEQRRGVEQVECWRRKALPQVRRRHSCNRARSPLIAGRVLRITGVVEGRALHMLDDSLHMDGAFAVFHALFRCALLIHCSCFDLSSSTLHALPLCSLFLCCLLALLCLPFLRAGSFRC